MIEKYLTLSTKDGIERNLIFTISIEGEYRKSTWSFNGADPEEYPNFTIECIEDVDNETLLAEENFSEGVIEKILSDALEDWIEKKGFEEEDFEYAF